MTPDLGTDLEAHHGAPPLFERDQALLRACRTWIETVRRAGGLYGPDWLPSDSVALPAALVRPHRDPSTLSYTVLATGATPQTYSTWLLTVVVRAFDTEYLVAEACRRYRECWDDATWRPATLGEAAYEVLLASNANPAPCALGFEFVSVEYAHDGPVTVPAAAEALTGTDDETTDAND